MESILLVGHNSFFIQPQNTSQTLRVDTPSFMYMPKFLHTQIPNFHNYDLVYNNCIVIGMEQWWRMKITPNPDLRQQNGFPLPISLTTSGRQNAKCFPTLGGEPIVFFSDRWFCQ